MPTAETETKKGPRKTCPACGTTNVSKATYCWPGHRAFLGVRHALDSLFNVGSPFCVKDGRHLHQSCNTCGCAWMGTPVGDG